MSQHVHDDIFVGRSKTMRQLLNFVDRVQKGPANMLFIQGEEGIGKTYLAEFFRMSCEKNGWYILNLASRPNLNFRELVRILQKDVEQLDENQQKLDGDTYQDLKAFFSGFKLVSDTNHVLQINRKLLFEKLDQCLALLLSNRPCLIWIDDLDETEQELHDWLLHLTQQDNVNKIIMLATGRRNESPRLPILMEIIHLLVREKRLNTIVLKPLTRAYMDEWVRLLLKGSLNESNSEAIYELTNGIPLYLSELLTSLLVSGGLIKNPLGWELKEGALKDIPLRIQLLLRPKFMGLSESEIELLDLIASSKSTLPWTVIKKATRMEDAQLTSLLSRLFKKGTIHEVTNDGISYSFNVSMLKEVFIASRQKNESMHAHLKLALAWENENILLAADHALVLLPDRPGDRKLATILLKAGEKVLELRDYDKALLFLKKADDFIKSWDKHDTLHLQVGLKLSEALTYKENPEQAILLLKRIYQLSQKDGDKLRIKRFLAWVESTRSFEACLDHIKDGLGLWDGKTENPDVLWLLNEQVFNDLNGGQITKARKSLGQLKAYANQFKTTRALILTALREAHLSLMVWDDPQIGNEKADYWLTEAQKLNDIELLYDVYTLFGYISINQGDLKKALRYAREGKELVRQHKMVIHEISIRLVEMSAYFMQGDWKNAYLEAEATEALSRDYKVYGAIVCTLDLRALILILQGKKEEAHSLFQESQRLTFEVYSDSGIHLSGEALHLIDALDDLLNNQLIDHVKSSVYWSNAHGMVYFLKLIEGIRLILSGQNEKLELLIQGLECAQQNKEFTYISGIVHLLKGMRKQAEQNRDEAVKEYKMALMQFEKLYFPLEKVLTQVFLSESLELLESKSLLEKSVRNFSNLGAIALTEWVNERYMARSKTTNFRLPNSPEALTKREVQILNAIATGLSNKEISKKMGVKEGTIKNHIVNIYGKLGVRSRIPALVRARDLGIITN